MDYEKHVLEIGREALQRLLQLMVCEAVEFIGEPIERYSLKHGLMKVDPDGQWVPGQRSDAVLVLLQVARGHIDAVWRAALNLPPTAETPEFVEAIHSAREFVRSTRVVEPDSLKVTP